MQGRKILVSIASFCDIYLNATVDKILNSASEPGNLDIIVINQSEQPENFQQANVTEVFVKYDKGRGVCWARSLINSFINSDHGYFLQIDAHSDFVTDWDVRLISELGGDKDVISTYPYPHDYKGDRPHSVNRVSYPASDTSFRFEGGEAFDSLGLKPSSFSGGFVFSHIDFIERIPYIPTASWDMEEYSMTLRGFLSGYTFRSIVDPPILHIYGEVTARKMSRPKTTYSIPKFTDGVKSISQFEVAYGIDMKKGEISSMISIPVAVNTEYFRSQLDLFWYAHKKTYGFTAYRKTLACVVNQDVPTGIVTSNIDQWNINIPYKMVKPFYKYDIEYDNVLKPLNIQYAILQILDDFPDDQVVEILDCDMFHFKQHPKIEILHNQVIVDTVYEDWHLKSLSDNFEVIEPYVKKGSGVFNGGFVPIISRISTLKVIIQDWINIHLNIQVRYGSSDISWWAGMFALQAACQRSNVEMLSKSYCYIANGTPVNSDNYIGHYSVDINFFNKKDWVKTYNSIESLPDNVFYNLVKDWKKNGLYNL